MVDAVRKSGLDGWTWREKALALAVALPAAVVIWVYRAYIFTILWIWFLADPYGLPRLTIIGAMGLNLMAAFVISSLARQGDLDKLIKPDETEMSRLWASLVRGAAFPTFALAFGWVLMRFA